MSYFGQYPTVDDFNHSDDNKAYEDQQQPIQYSA